MSQEEENMGTQQGGGAIEFNPFVDQPKPEPKPEPVKEEVEQLQVKPEEPKTEAKKEEKKPAKKVHPGKRIIIDKVVINIGVGDAGDKLLKAQKVLEMVTNQKSTQTISQTTNKDLAIRKGQAIGCKVTLRGKRAEEFLKKAFWVKQNRIARYSFDPSGNFSFGINDYTDFEGMRYNPEIGIFGMDISTSLMRPGYRVAKRKVKKGHVPKKHRITKEEGIQFAEDTFNLEVVH